MKKTSKKSLKRHEQQNTNVPVPLQPRWYSNPSLWIAILSLMASTIVEILSISNSINLALMEKDVYVPRLQYQIRQEEYGIVSIDVTNQGQVTARSLTIGILGAMYGMIAGAITGMRLESLLSFKAIKEESVSI
jgi:hypothetical protein